MAGTGLTGFLQNLTGTEMIVIAIVALVGLGPERMPEMARGAGRRVHKVRTMTDPSMQPLKELGELAARPRQKLTEYALEAEAEERAKKEAAAADRAEKERAELEEATTGDAEPEPTTADAAPATAPAAATGPDAEPDTDDDTTRPATQEPR